MPELTPEQKAQLDRNIRNMLSQGASEDDVIAYSKDFRAKYDIPVEKKNQVGNVSASGSGVGGLSTSQSQLQSQGVSRDIAGVQQGGLSLNEVSLKQQDENLPSTSRLKIQATDARVGGDEFKKENSAIGGVYNTIVGSVSRLAGGMVGALETVDKPLTRGIDKLLGIKEQDPSKIVWGNEPDAQTGRQLVTEFIDKARTATSTRENEQARSQFDITDGVQAKDVKALLFQAPSTILDMVAGAYTSGTSFFFQSVDDNTRELESIPEANNLTENEKLTYLFVQGTIQAALEKFGVDKILKASGLSGRAKQKIANEVTDEFLKLGQKATAEQIEKAVLRKVSTLPAQIQKVGAKAATSFGVEGGTEAIQQAASDGIKLLTNKLSGNTVFDEEDITANFIKNVINAGAQGGAFGTAVGGGVAAASKPISEKDAQAIQSDVAGRVGVEQEQPNQGEEVQGSVATEVEKSDAADPIKQATEAADTDIKDEIYRNAFKENPEQSLKELAQQLNGNADESAATRRMFGDRISDIALTLYPQEKVESPSPVSNEGEYNYDGGKLVKTMSFNQAIPSEDGSKKYPTTWYDIVDEGGNDNGSIAIADRGDHFQVTNVMVKGANKGVGTKVYKALAQQLGKPLYSDKAMTEPAERVWQKLVNEGVAEKIGDDRYRTKTPSPVPEGGGEVKGEVKSETPFKDEYGKRIENLDKESKQSDISNLSVGDYINIPQSKNSSGVTGFVKKVGRTNVIIETQYGGWGTSDSEPMELTVKKSDIKEFIKPKSPTNEAPIQEGDKPNQQRQQQAEETSQQSSQPTESQPPADPPKGEAAVGGEEGGTGITHAQAAETREQFGFEEYEKKPETFEEWDARADERIAKGDMPALIKKMQEGKTPSEVEQRMMGKYIAELAKKAEQNPSDENLNALHEAIVLSDIVGGREVGKSLVSRKGTFLPDDSLAGFFETERMINKDAPLTEAQKETVKKEWEELQKAKDAYNAYVFQKESELGAREAQAKIAEENQSSPTRKKGTRKTDKDFADERKQIITDIKDKLKKARGETQATILPFAKELIAISPDVAKLVRNLVDNGITKLADIVDRVHEILKEDIEKISKQDVIDLIAGNYNEKKKTRNQLARDLFELRTEAKLINEYNKLQSGIEPKKEKEKVQKNQKLETLRKQIKEHDLTKLSQVKSKLNSEIEKVENQIAKGDFAKPEKKPQIKLDKEGNALRDKLIKLQQQRDARMLLTQRQNEGSKARALRIAAEIFNIPRTLMTIGDFSGLLRQNLFFSVGHPGITAKALPGMFKSFTSQKVYDRWFADLKDTPRYDVIQKSRLAISDSLNHDLSKREEDFMSTLAEKIPVIGRDFNIGKGKMPGLNIVKGSERSYTMLLNKVRVDMFNYFADKMEARGLTVENSPKEYKAMAEYINNATGRSDFGERLNRIAPILNSVFFSPRLIASRVNMLTYWAQPRFWKTLPKEARIDYFRNWGSLLAVGGTIMALAAMAGADVEDDPRSSDFGKIKSGDTRWDIWGGAQPYVRAFAQVTTGKRKSTNSGKLYDLDGDDIFGENRMGAVTDFFRNKLAPVPGAAVDVLSGRTSIGDKIVYQWGDAEDKEISIDEYVKQRLLPMTITGTQEAIKQDGWERLFTVGIPSTFGVGTQAYEKSNTKPKTIKLYQPNGTKTREATPEEYAKYEKERDEIFVKKMDEIEKRGHVWLNKYGELTTSKDDKVKTKPLQDLTKEEKKDLSSRIKTQADNEAKKKIKF